MALAGCDLLTISPALLEQLDNMKVNNQDAESGSRLFSLMRIRMQTKSKSRVTFKLIRYVHIMTSSDNENPSVHMKEKNMAPLDEIRTLIRICGSGVLDVQESSPLLCLGFGIGYSFLLFAKRFFLFSIWYSKGFFSRILSFSTEPNSKYFIAKQLNHTLNVLTKSPVSTLYCRYFCH